FCSLFVLFCSAPRSPHSFPTRRSSDLLALVCIYALIRRAGVCAATGAPRTSAEPGDSIGGTTWSGIAEIPRSPYLLGIVAYVLLDRKSTRLNSSHVAISYAVFCLKKKN